MQVLILGDPHLGKSQNYGKQNISNINSRISDQSQLLDWVLDQAINNSVEHIVITGDVFEEPKPATYIITLFMAWLKKCQANQIHVHIIEGNHDILRTGNITYSPLDIINEADLDYIHIYREINTFFLETTAFTIIPFRDRKSYQTKSNSEALNILNNELIYELASIPTTYKKSIIGHLAIEGSIPIGDELDDVSNELFCPLSMFKGYDYVWMGHVHKFQVLKKKPYISHIGSMDISNFGEAGHKKYITIYNCNSGEFSNLEIPTRPLKNINISVPEDIEDVTEFLIKALKSEDLKSSIFKMEISNLSNSKLDKSKLEQHLYKYGVFNIARISETKKATQVSKKDSVLDSKMDIESAIKQYASSHLEESKQANFIELAFKLYTEFKINEAN